MPGEKAALDQAEAPALRVERVAEAAVSGDHELQRRMAMSQLRESINQHVESFLRLESSNGANHHVAGRQPERAPGVRFARAIALKLSRIDAVQHGRHAHWIGAGSDQLVLDIGRHRNHARVTREGPFVARVVEQPLTRRVSGPAVRGCERHDPAGTRERPGEQVAFVLVRVHDVYPAIDHHGAKRGPDAPVQRMALEDFHVIDGGRVHLLGDAERGVPLVAQIADRDLEPPAVRLRRTEQDRLFGPAAGAPNAPQLKNANRL